MPFRLLNVALFWYTIEWNVRRKIQWIAGLMMMHTTTTTTTTTTNGASEWRVH